MSVTTYAILVFAMMLILTAVLVSGKFTPSIPMIVIPIIFAVIMHPTFADLSDWVTSGLKGQVSNAAMFTFAIIFFGVMMDAGVFDKIVGKMMLGAKTVTAVCVLNCFKQRSLDILTDCSYHIPDRNPSVPDDL